MNTRSTGDVEVSSQFAAAFRAQAASWLRRVGMPRRGERPRFYTLGERRLVVGFDVEIPGGSRVEDVIVAGGRVRVGDRGRVAGPVFALGEVEAGKGCSLMAVAAGAKVMLGTGSRVSDWVDAEGDALLRTGVEVGGPVRGRRVELAAGASALSLFGREIVFGSGGTESVAFEQTPLVLGAPGEGGQGHQYWKTVPGFRAEKLTAVDASTWFYDGSLQFVSPLDLRGHLVVKGSFQCAEGSLIEGDVKAGAGLRVGAGSLVRGQLTSLGDLWIGSDTYFSGDLAAAGGVALGAGARGVHPERAVQVRCKGRLDANDRVVIRGEAYSHLKIQARGHGLEPREDLLQYREIC